MPRTCGAGERRGEALHDVDVVSSNGIRRRAERRARIRSDNRHSARKREPMTAEAPATAAWPGASWMRGEGRSRSSLAHPDARIDDGIEDVGEQRLPISTMQRREHQDAHHHRIVAVAEESRNSRPMPGQVNTVSVTSAPPSSVGNCRPATRDHRQQRVAQRVHASASTPLRHALGARGADVVLVDDVEHRGAHVAAPDRHSRPAPAPAPAQSDDAAVEQRAVADRVPVAGRQPAELHREDVDRDEAEPEGRESTAPPWRRRSRDESNSE